MLTAPEPLLLAVGDCLTYSLLEGEPRNPYVAPSSESDWAPDGWGAAVVLARYLVAALRVEPTTKPSLADCRVASILHERSFRGSPGMVMGVNCRAGVYPLPPDGRLPPGGRGQVPALRHPIRSWQLPH
jgi:hypothetical protein